MADPACPRCHGHGLIILPVTSGPPVSDVCPCVLRAQILSNMERGMRGLSKATPLDRGEVSPLMKFLDKDLWITASSDWFRSHLRYAASRVPNAYRWGFKVVSDSDLVVAWLATAALQGTDIIDADFRSEAASVSLTKLTLVDAVDPPELLIVRLGVKAARNSATSEVLMEALTHRAHVQKPTWVWDQPDNRLSEGHLSFSHAVVEFLSDFHRIQHADSLSTNTPPALSAMAPAKRVSLTASPPTSAHRPAMEAPAPPTDRMSLRNALMPPVSDAARPNKNRS